MKSLSTLTALAALLGCTLALDAAAATIRVQCEARPGRAKISVDAKSLAAGRYSTSVRSGSNIATFPATAAVGGEIETDYDSNPADIAAGATAISPTFITGGLVVAKVLDASGNTVIVDAVTCRVRTR